jgi:hypothetical protein
VRAISASLRRDALQGPQVPRWVNNGPDSAETGLPKCPREQTFAELVGMSQTCQKLTRVLMKACIKRGNFYIVMNGPLYFAI